MNLKKYHVSKNILDWTSWTNSIASINGNGTFTTDDSSISITSGTSTDAYTSPFGASNPNTYRMTVQPNTAYSISISGDNSYQLIAWENGSTASGNGHYMNSGVRFATFVTKSDTTFLTFRAANTGSLGSTATLRNVMVVEGEYTSQTMPTYDPYSADVWHDLQPKIYANGAWADSADNPKKYSNGSWS